MRIIGILITAWVAGGAIIFTVARVYVRPMLRARRLRRLEAENKRLDALIESDLNRPRPPRRLR